MLPRHCAKVSELSLLSRHTLCLLLSLRAFSQPHCQHKQGCNIFLQSVLLCCALNVNQQHSAVHLLNWAKYLPLRPCVLTPFGRKFLGMVSDRICKSVLVTLIPDTKSLVQVGHAVGFAEQPSSICKALGKVRKTNYQGSQCSVGVVSAIAVLSTSMCTLCSMYPVHWVQGREDAAIWMAFISSCETKCGTWFHS